MQTLLIATIYSSVKPSAHRLTAVACPAEVAKVRSTGTTHLVLVHKYLKLQNML